MTADGCALRGVAAPSDRWRRGTAGMCGRDPSSVVLGAIAGDECGFRDFGCDRNSGCVRKCVVALSRGGIYGEEGAASSAWGTKSGVARLLNMDGLSFLRDSPLPERPPGEWGASPPGGAVALIFAL